MKFGKNKRLLLLISGLFASALFFYLATIKGQPMHLVNVKTGFVVVEFQKEKTVFHDKFLEQSMKKQGIVIPPALRNEFSGKAIIRLSDLEFQKAFKEIYYPLSYNRDTYQWKDSSKDDHHFL